MLSANIALADTPAPVGQWNFNECSGISATDASGNSNTGTITIGATGTQTQAGTCTDGHPYSSWYNGAGAGMVPYELQNVGDASLSVDGTNDYVQVADSSSLDVTTDLTISVWFKKTRLGNYEGLVTKENNIGQTPGVVWGIQTTAADKLQFSLDHANADAESYYSLGTVSITDTNWHHYAVVYTATPGTIIFYVDGVLDHSYPVANSGWSGNLETSTGPLYIGGGPGSAWNISPAQGNIDNVEIYNQSLTAAKFHKFIIQRGDM